MYDYIMNTAETSAQKLIFYKVDHNNLPEALKIQHTVWPNNPVDHDYLDKINHPKDLTNANWLAYHHNHLVGLTGIFTFDPDEPGYDGEESVWMDWFAVLPEHRGTGLGKQILLATINYAKVLGRFKYFRLDTTDFPERISTQLYDHVMQLREDYTAEDMPSGHKGLVYSYSLTGSKIQPWNNRFLNLNYYNATETVIN